MNKIALTGVVILAVAGAVWWIPERGPQPPPEPTDRPSSTLTIHLNDPGDLAAIKFLALYADGLAREGAPFTAQLRSQEFAGPAPAAAAWRVISQDVLKASQEGLAQKIETLQDDPRRWEAAADYHAEAINGWRQAAEALRRLAEKAK